MDQTSQNTAGLNGPGGARFELTTSRQFESWLNDVDASLVFTTYQAGKIILIGRKENGRLSVFERTLDRPMALCVDADGFWVSTLTHLWRFADVIGQNGRGGAYDGYDRLFAPRLCHVTGDIDIHDLDVDATGALLMANTLFSCVATVSAQGSFRPVWRPPFITRLAPEDRCHLNGFALSDGRLAYATAVAAVDVGDGWRDRRADGGVLIDCQSGEIACAGLAMPHSPRVHDGRVWLVNAGSGELGVVDLNAQRFEPVAFLPGFLRGLSFLGPYALVTASLPRENRTFSGLPLDDRLKDAGVAPRCGLFVVDTRTGDAPHWLRIEGIVSELFDVAPLPGVRRPAMIGFRSDEIRRVIAIDGE